jgi:hypothetical protein
MWNEKRSLTLSKVFTVLFIAALAAALVFAPRLVRWLIYYSVNAHSHQFGNFLITLYAGGAVLAVMLVCLYILLYNIGKGQVFTPKNISLLRGISWCCFVGGFICLVSAIYYLPWLAVALAAALMGLIVRVIKNMVQQALRLKEENDYTI